MLMDQVPGDPHTFYSVDSAFTEDGEPAEETTTEFMRTVVLPGIAPSVSQLKVGAPMMLMRNLNPRVGLCNGILRMTSILQHSIPFPFINV